MDDLEALDEHLFDDLDQKDDIQNELLDKSLFLLDNNPNSEDSSVLSAWRQFVQFEGFSFQDVLTDPAKRWETDEEVNFYDRFVAEFERRALAARSAGCAYTDNILAFKLLEKCGTRDKTENRRIVEDFLSSIPLKLLEQQVNATSEDAAFVDDSSLHKFSNSIIMARKVRTCGDTFLSLVKTFVKNLLVTGDEAKVTDEMDVEDNRDDGDTEFAAAFKFLETDNLDGYNLDEHVKDRSSPINLLDLIDSVLEEEKARKEGTNDLNNLASHLEDPKDLNPDYYQLITDKRTVDVRLRPIISCGDCLFLTDSQEEMTRHADIRHKLLHCPHCRHQATDENKLKMHMRNTHGHFMIKCRKCELYFATWAGFTLHKLEHHEDDHDHKYECEECDKIYTYFPYYSEHINQAHKGISFSCDKCNVVFGANEHFLAHKKIHKRFRPCKECNKKFVSKKALLLHRRKVHGLTFRRKQADETFKHACDICDETFASRKTLMVHCRRKHKPKDEEASTSTVACDQCPGIFGSERALNNHVRMKHSESGGSAVTTDAQKCTCEECGKSFNRRSNLHSHRKSVHQKVRHLCKECPRVFRSHRKLLIHENNVHGENPVDESELCDQCGHRSVNKSALAQHKRKMHRFPRRHACPHCDYTDYDSYKLRIHITVKHEGKKLQCKECNYECTSLFTLYRHRKMKHPVAGVDAGQLDGVKPDGAGAVVMFHCDMCVFKSRTPEYLSLHKKTVHEGHGLPCEVCAKVFPTKQRLQYHIEATHEDRRYECDQCDYVAKAAILLRNHKNNVHEKRYRSPCVQCDYVAPNPTSLKTHVQIKHEGIKFACDQCDFVGPNPNSLRRHIKVIHNMKRFYCDQCDYMAKDNYTLKIHKEKKHQGIQYPCDECGMKFTLVYSLKKHKQSKHPPPNPMMEVKYIIPGHVGQ